jgi:CelD/BcsL family acetyltransferase involved in cellulose biosynthesis
MSPADSRDPEHYRVTVERELAPALARWQAWERDGAVIGLFQRARWLQAWYATLGAQAGREPLLVSIERSEDGRPLLGLPLVRERRGRLRCISFADAGVSDYVAPVCAPDCPEDPAEMRALFAALRRALPAADLWSLEKMPGHVGERRNPLLQLQGTRPSALFGNPVSVGEDFDAWRFSREKTHRKELERSWRVFSRHPQARWERIEDVGRAMQVMDALEALQREAIRGKGWAYLLDEPGYREFYRDLLTQGLSSGETVLTALVAGEEIVAALLGVRHGDEYAMIRIGNAAGEWRNCSPGRLVIERTMAALHAQGVRRFDFTIGDYAYKRGFQPDRLDLYESVRALSWRGWPHSLRARLLHHARTWLARRPQLKERLLALRARGGAEAS